jgi:DNA (cytosine-5)-methyltransferase 1
MFIHPDINQCRSISVKEAALLQSFPDDYEFTGSQGHMFKMIGNAVPPEMARNIANAIFKRFRTK